MSKNISSRSQNIRVHFDRAHHYQQHAVFQRHIAGRLMDYFQQVFGHWKPTTILELGCGDGIFTKWLHKLWPNARITASDFSRDMLKRAQKQFKKAPITFKEIDLNKPPGDLEQYDLVCSNLAFQWLDSPAYAMKIWAHYVKNGGFLAVTHLLKGTFAQWEQACDKMGVKSGVPDYPSRQEVDQWNFYPAQSWWEYEDCQQIFESGWHFLKSLKDTGTSLARSDYVPMTYKTLRKVSQIFTEDFDSTISWHVAFRFIKIPPTEGVFITGTDTDIGKTITSASVTKAFNGTYWKLFQTGLQEDDGDLKTICRLTGSRKYLQAFGRFLAPLCPFDAAQKEGKHVDLTSLNVPQLSEDQQPLIVEGAGGVMVPVTDKIMMIDLIKDFGLPVIIVAKSDQLGMINHTLLTIDALRQRHIAIAGVILNGDVNMANQRHIEKMGKVRIIAQLPFRKTITPETIKEFAKRIPPWSELFPSH